MRAWYFRNALVRANYNHYGKGIKPDAGYSERFFRNVLLGEHNVLKNAGYETSVTAQIGGRYTGACTLDLDVG